MKSALELHLIFRKRVNVDVHSGIVDLRHPQHPVLTLPHRLLSLNSFSGTNLHSQT